MRNALPKTEIHDHDWRQIGTGVCEDEHGQVEMKYYIFGCPTCRYCKAEPPAVYFSTSEEHKREVDEALAMHGYRMCYREGES